MTASSTAAVIYARISKDRNGEALGVARQEADCRALAAARGYAVTSVLIDNDVSAFSGKRRPNYERLLEGIAANRWGVVLAWHPDRLHRRPIELEQFIALVEDQGVGVETVRAGEHDFATADGRMRARLTGAVARNQSERASENLVRKHQELAARGRPSGGPRPFGFEEDGKTVRPDEAAIVVEMCERLVAGSSVRSIAGDLNRRDIRTARGVKWAPGQVRQVILRPRNVGQRVHRGVTTRAVWEPLVDAGLWADALVILRDPGRNRATTTERRHLLSGILTCGVCGNRVKTGQTGRSVTVYRCTSNIAGGRSCLSRDLLHVDQLVTETVIRRLSQPDAAELFARADDTDRAAQLDREAREIRRRLDRAAESYVIEVISVEALQKITIPLRERLDQIEAERAALLRERQPALQGLIGAEDVTAAWDSLDLSQRRAVIDELINLRLLPSRRGRGFDPSSIEITWKT